MAVISYQAVDRGYLVPTHTPGTSYDVEFSVSKYDRNLDTDKSVPKSLSGRTETFYKKTELLLAVTATFIDEAGVLDFEEFATSVAAGESFFFDPTGTVLLPGPITYSGCKLDSDNLAPSRIAIGINARFDINLDIRVEIP